MTRIRPLANECVTVCESPDPARIYSCSPGLAVLPSGRLVATLGLRGPGAAELPGVKATRGGEGRWQGKVFTSGDRGATWTFRTDFPFLHARPFVAGGALYVLGHAGDLTIMRSDDGGENWSPPAKLTEGQSWHQAPCNVHYANGCVYLVMERRTRFEIAGWPVGELAPVLMRGRIGDDLTDRSSWTFASELPFYEAIAAAAPGAAAIPFYEADPRAGVMVAPGRHCAPMGWLEANVVQFVDPDHIWFDPAGRTFHLWMRAHTGGTGYAAIAKVVEAGPHPGEGAMTTVLQAAPSGRPVIYVACPGGQMKFHVLYDEPTKLYWLLSTQATDSMTRPDRLPPDRYNLPNNERRRLQLHFSRNAIDWCFAGLVAVGPADRASRNYASMAIDGDDLHVLSRSGDLRAASPHDGNLITFHTVRGFRRLVY